jgi:hypothetical protein
LVDGGQPFEEQATEKARKHPDGKEETGPAGNPVLAIGQCLSFGRCGRSAPAGRCRDSA